MAGKDVVSEFDDIFSQPAIVRSWPSPKTTASWPEALRLAGASSLAGELEACAKTAHACIPMAGYPIVGVLGQLNAGKSSVVASFLSATGQARLPRGLHDGQGTHRFVYWLPEKWRDESAIWDSFRALLDQVHGSQIEYLDDDPSQAAVQYGNGLGKPDIIRRPLIAFDQALNDGLCFSGLNQVLVKCAGLSCLLAVRVNPIPTIKSKVESVSNLSCQGGVGLFVFFSFQKACEPRDKCRRNVVVCRGSQLGRSHPLRVHMAPVTKSEPENVT